MNNQSSDPTVVHTSIALLQERFRQLQKAKEQRERRELLRLHSETQPVDTNPFYDPSKLFFHSELIRQPRPPPRGSPSFQHNLQSMHTDLQSTETTISANVWSTDAVVQGSNIFNDSDVDTSLHL